MELHVYKEPGELSRALAEWIAKDIGRLLKVKERYVWALTGGNSPKELYRLMASDEYRNRIPWEKLYIFWGDERAVPFDDERNNARMTFENLLNLVPIPKGQVHIMETGIDPDMAAAAYEEILKAYFQNPGSGFDLLLTGMGEDGHTLSLFPGTGAIHESSRWVTAFYLAPQSMFRITLTPIIANRSSRIVFLAFGDSKSHALKQVLEGERNVDLYPAQVIQPVSGELHWFVDQAAASRLASYSTREKI